MHRLRGHHLICLHFFRRGEENFRENLSRILSSISEVEVVKGVDDVCKACRYNEGFCNYSSKAEEEVSELDRFALHKLGVEVGSKVKWEELKAKVSKIIEEWKDFACRNCDWRGDCDV